MPPDRLSSEPGRLTALPLLAPGPDHRRGMPEEQAETPEEEVCWGAGVLAGPVRGINWIVATHTVPFAQKADSSAGIVERWLFFV
jgi:hypothetical protein